MTQGLVVTDLAVGYGRRLVEGISFAIAPGEIVCLVGPNGSGKSTILRTIAGVIPSLHGTIAIAGTSVETWPAWRRVAEAKLAYVTQSARNFRNLTVSENLHLGFYSDDVPRRARERAIDELLSRDVFTPLRRRIGERAGGLSGGEELLLAVGRATMRRPFVVLFDEPSAGLFVRYRDLVVELIRHVSANAAVLVVEQMLPVVGALSGMVYQLEQETGQLASTIRKAAWTEVRPLRGL